MLVNIYNKVLINYDMEDINKKYFGVKIAVVNAKSTSVVRYKYLIRFSKILENAVFIGLCLAICINWVFILKGIIWLV